MSQFEGLSRKQLIGMVEELQGKLSKTKLQGRLTKKCVEEGADPVLTIPLLKERCQFRSNGDDLMAVLEVDGEEIQHPVEGVIRNLMRENPRIGMDPLPLPLENERGEVQQVVITHETPMRRQERIRREQVDKIRQVMRDDSPSITPEENKGMTTHDKIKQAMGCRPGSSDDISPMKRIRELQKAKRQAY